MGTLRQAWERLWRTLPPEVLASPLTGRGGKPAKLTYDLLNNLFPELPPSLRERRYLAAQLTSEDERHLTRHTDGYPAKIGRAARLSGQLLAQVEQQADHPAVRARTHGSVKNGSNGEALTLTKRWLARLGLDEVADEANALGAFVREAYGIGIGADDDGPPTYPRLAAWVRLPEVRERFEQELALAWGDPTPRPDPPVGPLPIFDANPFDTDKEGAEARLGRALRAAAAYLVDADHQLEPYLCLRTGPARPVFARTADGANGKQPPLDRSIVERLRGPLTRKTVAHDTLESLVRWEITQASGLFGLAEPRDRQLLVVGCSLAQYPLELESPTPLKDAPFTTHETLATLHRTISRRFFGAADLTQLPERVAHMAARPIKTLAPAMWERLHNNAAAGQDEAPLLTLRNSWTNWLGDHVTASRTYRRTLPIDEATERRLAADNSPEPDLDPDRTKLLELVLGITDDQPASRAVFQALLALPDADRDSPDFQKAWGRLGAWARAVDPEGHAQGIFTPDGVRALLRSIARER